MWWVQGVHHLNLENVILLKLVGVTCTEKRRLVHLLKLLLKQLMILVVGIPLFKCEPLGLSLRYSRLFWLWIPKIRLPWLLITLNGVFVQNVWLNRVVKRLIFVCVHIWIVIYLLLNPASGAHDLLLRLKVAHRGQLLPLLGVVIQSGVPSRDPRALLSIFEEFLKL